MAGAVDGGCNGCAASGLAVEAIDAIDAASGAATVIATQDAVESVVVAAAAD